ncbi:hypothetical protein HHI36_021000 [Cryptolaemus montrouzieri]|uniref:Gamma-tubulin complex component n=1 Tax=Cryptolaemus montrouzieri TaxID=559131 RepID=A0ABD2MVM8_9CUCU
MIFECLLIKIFKMNTEINIEVKNLIQHIYQSKNNIEVKNAKEKQVLIQLKKGDTMSFVNKKDMDVSIQKMAEKFQFHGFFLQADHLLKMYDRYMNKTPKQDHTNALNVVRFLLYMSESPTNKFLENPEDYLVAEEEKEGDDINWAEYLLEGIETYCPQQFEDTSDDSDQFESAEESDAELTNENVRPILESNTNIGIKMNFNLNHQELMSSIQHTWYNKEYYLEKPFSKRTEANTGLLWEEYLQEQTHGFIDIETSSFISEYKVIREIMWQMFGTHNSFLFRFKGDKLNIRSNVSISSMRGVCFEAFMQQFLDYIELMEFFRNFLDSFKEYEVCQTYLCYRSGIIRNVLNPIFENLMAIEETVRKQEETYTLLRLCEDLIPIFAPLKILREIHQKVIVSAQENLPLYCATSLLCNLHSNLKHSITKLEHDLKMTLYLESLFKYFFLMDSWLTRNDFVDINWEFVLVQYSSTQTVEYKTSPFLSARISYQVNEDIKEEYQNDGIIQIICKQVLQIAKNIRLLFLLRKFDFYCKSKETLYQELVRRFLEELCGFFNYKDEDVFQNLSQVEEMEPPKVLAFKYPVISSEMCKKPTEMDKLDNLVDINNSFLMEAFADFFYEPKSNIGEYNKNMTLFDRINKITAGIFPFRNCIEKIFLDILKERFSVSGLMVKGTLVEDHHLECIFELLRALFLFCDAGIFPFFQQFFEEMKFLPNTPWRYMKLSSVLKDMVIEKYPLICDKCDITLSSSREQSMDQIDICDNVNINIVMKWPLNIVINEEEINVYKSLFHFLIKLKWALHTLKGLSCKEIFNINMKKTNKLLANTAKKLEVFRFNLLGLLNFIQHYVMCFCLTKCLKNFELDFEKSKDLDSIIKSHCEFIEGMADMVQFLQEDKEECNMKTILHCVKIVQSMWHNQDLALNEEILNKSYKIFKKCNSNIRTKVNRIYHKLS